MGLLFLVGLCPENRAQSSSVPRSDFWVTDGPVYAIVETNGVVYLGGDFSSIGPNQSRTALHDAKTGLADPAFPFVEGTVLAAAPDGQGGWYLGGSFSEVAGEPRINLARLQSDLSLDPDWTPSANDSVHAIAVDGGMVYIGGQFTEVDGRQRHNLAAINPSSGNVTDWNPSVCCAADPQTRSRVSTLAVRDGRIYAGGAFGFVGGQPRNNLVLLDASSNEALPWPENEWNPDNFVSTLFLAGDLLYVGGRFQFMGDAPRANIAAVNTASGIAIPWNPAANGDVDALVVSGNTVFAGGSFTTINGQLRPYIAAIDITTGLARAWNPAADGAVLRLQTSDGLVYAGGDFTTIGGVARSGLAALIPASGGVTPWNPVTTSRPVQCLAGNGQQVLAAGLFVRGAKRRNGLAALDARTGLVLDWDPNADQAVFALAATDDAVYAGGDFKTIGGEPRAGTAVIDVIDGSPLPWGTSANGPNGRVEAIAVTTDRIYVAGGFSAVGPMFAPGMVALDRFTGQAVLWRPIADRPVHALMVSENVVYASGSFSVIGTQPRNGFAALNITTAAALGWNPDALGAGATGWTMARSGDVIYVGGSFIDIGGQLRLHLAALDVATGQATGWNPSLSSLNDSVQRVSVAGGAVYVAGAFSSIGGQLRHHLAALDASSAQALEWNPDPQARSDSLAVSIVEATGAAVYIGGGFNSLAGRRHPYFAAFLPVGAPQIIRQPAHTIGQSGQPVALSVDVSGQPPLSIQWQRNGTNIVGATTTNLFFASAQTTNSGDYSVIVTNSLGQVASASATLNVMTPVAIASQPVDRSVASGSTVNFAVAANGSPPLLYQWKLNGVPLQGKTSATLSLTNVQPSESGRYSVAVYNGIESVESRAAVLMISALQLPFADNFFNRLSTNSATGTGTGSNTFATTEFALGEPNHAGKPGGHSVWYSWIAPASGIATIHTHGSDFDTLLAAYAFSSFGGLDVVGENDDSDGFPTSLISFNAVAGTRYDIAIDGYAGRTGRIVLTWNLQTTSDRLPRILLQPAGQSVGVGASVVLTVVADGTASLSYQWLRNGIPVFGATNLFLPMGNFQKPDAGQYSVVVSNPSRSVQSARASLEIGPVPEVVSQDKMEDLFLADSTAARFIPLALGIDGGQVFNSTGAATQFGEPNPCGALGGSSRWLRLRPSSAGTVVLDTVGSSFDTVLAVYTGTNLSSLTSVVCDNDGAPDGSRSFVRFEAVQGADYLVAVNGVSGAQGEIRLNWKFGVAPFIAASPVNRLLRQGESLTLGITPVAAVPSPGYQWRLNDQLIPGANTTTLVLTNLQPSQSGTYSIVAGNLVGSVTNIIANVIVAAPIQLSHELVPASGRPLFRVRGPVGAGALIEATTNFVNWVPIKTNASSTLIDFLDPASTNLPARFYRVVPWP